MKNITLLIIVLVLLPLSKSFAGYFEFSVTNNFRSSRINEYNYSKTNSLTGSISYYFMEMSALELSYTEGVTEQKIKPTNANSTVYTFEFRHYGVDFVFSLASRQSIFQPYVKAGTANVKKTFFTKEENLPRTKNDSPDAEWLPSLGIGFKFKITKNLALKAGIDTWGKEKQNFNDWDNAARIGISLFL